MPRRYGFQSVRNLVQSNVSLCHSAHVSSIQVVQQKQHQVLNFSCISKMRPRKCVVDLMPQCHHHGGDGSLLVTGSRQRPFKS